MLISCHTLNVKRLKPQKPLAMLWEEEARCSLECSANVCWPLHALVLLLYPQAQNNTKLSYYFLNRLIKFSSQRLAIIQFDCQTIKLVGNGNIFSSRIYNNNTINDESDMTASVTCLHTSNNCCCCRFDANHKLTLSIFIFCFSIRLAKHTAR